MRPKENKASSMKNLLIGLFLIITSTTFASHIVGGEVYYDSLGNDAYKVTFEVYRDCEGAGFDSPLQYTVFTAAGAIFSTYMISLPIADTLPIVYDDPCVTPPNDICIARAIYIDTIILPATPNGYYISYQRCCWANNIQNITNPGNWGLTITTNVPGTNLVAQYDNNCARFNNYPPIVLCANNTLTFDHSAFDADGDSLVYSMCTPKTVDLGPGNIPEPNPEYPAPYADVTWEPGFTGVQPWGPGSNVTINSQTGLMDITPSLVGTYVAGVCVEEYRNGVLINTKVRTFGYRVVVCDIVQPLEIIPEGNFQVINNEIIGLLIEDCGQLIFHFEREDTTEAVVIGISIGGSATEFVDYNGQPDSVFMDVGIASDSLAFNAFGDNFIEGDEEIIIYFTIPDPCGGIVDTTIARLTLRDYMEMSISIGDSTNVCDELGEYGSVSCSIQNGVGPYSYTWSPTPYANNDTIIFPATDLVPNLNYMYVEATDACGKSITSELVPVYNQCPCKIPNVITMNGDGINDEFVIRNIEDYDRVRVLIFNRWGNLVFEDDNYQNNWKGEDLSGKPLEAGVYSYIVMPESVKYQYDDQDNTLYTAHGFVHIIK